MKIEMLTDRHGSHNGINTVLFRKGSIYEVRGSNFGTDGINEFCATSFLKSGFALKVVDKPLVQPPKDEVSNDNIGDDAPKDEVSNDDMVAESDEDKADDTPIEDGEQESGLFEKEEPVKPDFKEENLKELSLSKLRKLAKEHDYKGKIGDGKKQIIEFLTGK